MEVDVPLAILFWQSMMILRLFDQPFTKNKKSVYYNQILSLTDVVKCVVPQSCLYGDPRHLAHLQ